MTANTSNPINFALGTITITAARYPVCAGWLSCSFLRGTCWTCLLGEYAPAPELILKVCLCSLPRFCPPTAGQLHRATFQHGTEASVQGQPHQCRLFRIRVAIQVSSLPTPFPGSSCRLAARVVWHCSTYRISIFPVSVMIEPLVLFTTIAHSTVQEFWSSWIFT
jgi:hypothetical protein